MTTDPLPDRISLCARGGYHSRGAGPCFETIEEAIAFRVLGAVGWAMDSRDAGERE